MSDIIISGLAGLLVGLSRYKNYDALIEAIKTRNENIIRSKIIIPVGYFDTSNEAVSLYSEGVNCYIHGFPNASLVLMFRCLETGLKSKFELEEKRKPNKTSSELIDWAEKYIGKRRGIAHGFRIIRNLVHQETLIEEQDAIEAIRHISKILNLIYPFENVFWQPGCSVCNNVNEIELIKEEAIFGNEFKIKCVKCGTTFQAIFRV